MLYISEMAMYRCQPCLFTLMWSQLIGVIRPSKRSVQKPNYHLRGEKTRGGKRRKEGGKLLDFSPSHTSLLLLTPRPQSSIFHLLSVITSSKLGQWLGGRQQYNSQSGEGGTTRDSWEPLIDQLYSCLTEYPPKPMQTWGEKKLDHRPHSRQAWGSKCFVCLNYH